MRGKPIFFFGEWARQVDLCKRVGIFRTRALDMWVVLMRGCSNRLKYFF